MLEKGTILISEPYLEDPNFDRTVVLLCDYVKEDGAIGFILNKKTDLLLNDLVEGLENQYQYPVQFGGPVATDTLFFLYRCDQAMVSGSIELADGLYWGGDFDDFKEKLNFGNLKAENVKIFLGYSGWSEGQLEEEIKSKAWYTYNFDSEIIIESNPETMWKEVLRKKGGKYKMISNYPIDPKLN
jgi:putative transcriptional regulator